LSLDSFWFNSLAGPREAYQFAKGHRGRRSAETIAARHRFVDALHLGLSPERLITSEGIEVLAGNRVPEGAEPLATAYAGFQFGNWVPQLGDGRAILLGELIDRDGVRRDVQLKGGGPPTRTGGETSPGLATATLLG
jgi:uncharacterized protein YdiU (UPF0061 family)